MADATVTAVRASLRRGAQAAAGPVAAAFIAAAVGRGASDPAWLVLGVVAAACLGAWLAARGERARTLRLRSRLAVRRRAARRAAEAAAEARSEAARRAALEVLDGAPAALAVLDPSGVVTYANPAMAALADRDPTGAPFAEAFRAPALVEAVARAAADGEDAEARLTIRRPAERRLRAFVRPLPGGDGRVCVLLVDETRQRRAEELHRDFVANASHELKTPLAAVSGFIETLRGPARDDPGARARFLDIMAGQTTRMAKLVADLLSLNRIELNEHVPPTERVALAGLVRAAAADVGEAAQKPISVRVSAEAEALEVFGDALELNRAFSNLIENAVKYGDPERAPIVWLARADEPELGAMVTVEDFGRGIAPQHLPRLTERFYRAEPAGGAERGRPPPGSGLGLAIVERAVSRHRGALRMESRLGVGSRFTVVLPLATKTSASDSPILDAVEKDV